MKSYEEMAEKVLERIHQYNTIKMKKKYITLKITATVCPVAVAVIAGVTVWKTGFPDMSGKQTYSVTSDNAVSTRASGFSSDSDNSRNDSSTSEKITVTDKTSVPETFSENLPINPSEISSAEISSTAFPAETSAPEMPSTAFSAETSAPEIPSTAFSAETSAPEIPNESTPTNPAEIYQNTTSVEDVPDCGYPENPQLKISGGNYYDKLSIEQYAEYNIPEEISESDLGEFIGNVGSAYNKDENYKVTSYHQEIADAEVYYSSYSKAMVIVKKNGQYDFFATTDRPHYENRYPSFQECFNFYGAESVEDIQSISYTISVIDGPVFKVVLEETIEDYDRINAIIEIFNQLEPEESTEFTPQWYIDAMDDYRNNKEAYNVEDIIFDIQFTNNTVLKDILYKPYVGNGYISNMKELTETQNTELRSLLKQLQ